jgi:acyl-CoA reductase-like NAD-dependent aldehyde dehydrogenase
MHNVYNGIISSLFVGNAIVVKVSEQVAWSAKYYFDVVKECLKAFGHSEDVVQFVVGEAEVGDALVRSGVDHVSLHIPGIAAFVLTRTLGYLYWVCGGYLRSH